MKAKPKYKPNFRKSFEDQLRDLAKHDELPLTLEERSAIYLAAAAWDDKNKQSMFASPKEYRKARKDYILDTAVDMCRDRLAKEWNLDTWIE